MSKKGFTLVETLFVSAIMVVLMGILTVALVQSRIIFQATDISATLQRNSRQALNKIAADLMRTNRLLITITQNSPVAGTDVISYRLPLYSGGQPVVTTAGAISWDSNITIGLEAGGSGRLIKTEGSTITVLATNINKINFFDHNRDATLLLDELRIVLELRDTSTEGRVYNLISTSIIKMRN